MCAIDSEGVKPSMSVEGAVDSKAFESYIEHLLAPRLKRGQIVVMDNLSVHKSKQEQARQTAHRGGRMRACVPSALLA